MSLPVAGGLQLDEVSVPLHAKPFYDSMMSEELFLSITHWFGLPAVTRSAPTQSPVPKPRKDSWTPHFTSSCSYSSLYHGTNIIHLLLPLFCWSWSSSGLLLRRQLCWCWCRSKRADMSTWFKCNGWKILTTKEWLLLPSILINILSKNMFSMG